MSNYLNLNGVVENLKLIADAIRCTVWHALLKHSSEHLKHLMISDSHIETKLRYPCGHTACANCTEASPLCFLCLTPPPEGSVPVIDGCLSNRTRNALILLKEFKEVYNIEIDQWRRNSKQLKLEKELFPQCIQAPQTYGNKRKTLNTSSSDKENSYLFPGELVTEVNNRMNRSKSYVQEWLDQNEKELSDYKPRKPFSDLAVNSPGHKITTIKKRADIILDKLKESSDNFPTSFRGTPGRSRKRQHFVAKTSHKGLDNYLKFIKKSDSSKSDAKKVKNEFGTLENRYTNTKKKNEKDESGIVMDDDAVIVIDDSQIEAINERAVDKDRLAWMAILEADRNNSCAEQFSTDLHCDEIVKYTDEVEKTLTKNYSIDKNTPTCTDLLKTNLPLNDCVDVKVPFYKRSYLNESCRGCEKSAKRSIKAKDVSITVETNTLRTTITVSKLTNKRPLKTSQMVQTEKPILDIKNKVDTQPQSENKIQPLINKTREVAVCNQESEDLFTIEQALPVTPCALLGQPDRDSSDSEQDYMASGEVTVIADVHKSVQNESPSVLRERSPAPARRRAPVTSPASSNSSNKENRDPNTLACRRPIKKKKKLVL